MKSTKINKTLNIFICLMLVLSLFVFNKNNVSASVDTNFKTPTESSGEFTPRTIVDGDYVDATNGYEDGDIKYYLITHDATKAGLTEIEYKGTTYQLEAVEVVAEEFNFITFAFTNKDGSKIHPLAGGKNDGNFTLFFDDGIYHDLVSTNYTAFSHENGSYIGLNKTNGEPAAIISKAARAETTTSPDITGLIERNIIMHENVYLENLTFDGRNRDMVPAAYEHNGKTKKHRGEYYFNITGGNQTDPAAGQKTNGLVMRELVIENIGDNDNTNEGSYSWFFGDTRRKNVAINVHYNPGQINIEDIVIRNVQTDDNYGVIQLQDSDSVYLKGVELDMDGAEDNATPVKLETTNDFTALTKQEQKYVIDDFNTSNVKEASYDNIYVQDYRYEYVKLPEAYRYAYWNLKNGSYFGASFNAYKDLPVAKATKAIQDLKDNYWIVDTTSTDVTIEEQLINIGLVINYTKEDVRSQKSPKAQIKFIGDNIPSFDFPTTKNNIELWKNADGTDMDVDIVAVKSVDDDIMTTTDMVPTVADFKANFENVGLVSLYNFDFKENSKYTYHEVNYPVELFTVTDPYDGNYSNPMNSADYAKEVDTSAITKNGSVAGEAEKGVSYHNSLFVGLVSKLNATFDATENVDKYEMVEGTENNVSVDIKDDETYTSAIAIDNANTKAADDKNVHYESSDTAIATVDANGKVTAVKAGEVTIYVKAIDSFNNGEVEKPYASFKLVVKEAVYKATHSFVSADPDLKLPSEVTELKPADQTDLPKGTEVNPTQPTTSEVKVEGGKWMFIGYEPTSVTIDNADVNFVGTWEFEKDIIVLKEVTTRWIDEEGKDLKPVVKAKTSQEAGTIEGYTFVKTVTDKDDNVTHHFKKNSVELPATGERSYEILSLFGGISLIAASLILVDKKYRINK